MTLAVAIGMGMSAVVAGAFPEAAAAAPPAVVEAPLPKAAARLYTAAGPRHSSPAVPPRFSPAAPLYTAAVPPRISPAVPPHFLAAVPPHFLAAVPLGLAPLSSGLAVFSEETADGRGIKPKQLKAALLTADELPTGYQQLVKPTVLEGNFLAANVTGVAPDDFRCDLALDPDKLLDPTAPAPAMPSGHTAIVLLSKGDAGPVVAELLAAGTPKAARAYVATFAGQTRRCPTITIGLSGSPEKLVVTQSPLRMPSVGDASAAASIKIGDGASAVHVKVLAFAKGRIAGAVVLAGAEQELRGFSTIVRAAVRKLRVFEKPGLEQLASRGEGLPGDRSAAR